jgi:hypothetical protein
LLYADDTLFFLKLDPQQLRLIELVLSIFHQLSGLKVNLHKSELLVMNMYFSQVQQLANIIGRKSSDFPLMYLGLPLSSKALPKQYYQRVVDTIQERLPGFHTSKLSIAGRIVILNSVISAMPVYFMLVFLLPEWVIKAIDRIRRIFFGTDTRTIKQVKGAYA